MPMLNADGEPVHFAMPFARDATTGKVNVVVQDTLEHVTSQVNVVVSYPVGYRPENPSFGIPWPFGRPVPVDGDAIQRAVSQLVPGADLAWTEYAGASVADRILELDVSA